MASSAASASLNLLAADYLALGKEAGRRHSDVRDAAEKAQLLLKSSRDQALIDLRADPPPSPQPLYHPIFLAATTRNSKIIALAVSSLQRLITAGAVPKGLVKQILETLEQVIPQGVEIQLKILQTLVSLLTTTVGGSGDKRGDRLVQGEELGQALELSHRLSTSKIPVVASTASATLRQLFMFVFERVGEEDDLIEAATASDDTTLLASLPPAAFTLDVPRPDEAINMASLATQEGEAPAIVWKEREDQNMSIALRPAARDAYLLLEDLCLLISGSAEGGPEGEPSFLRWGTLSRTFGLELVESIVSGFGPVVRTHPELLLVLRAHLCPLLIRFLSSPPSTPASNGPFSFPLTLRLTRVVFLLLKQFSDLLPIESEVFLSMFVRVIGPGDKGDGEGGHPAGPGAGSTPLWMRVLALEIFRGLCSDFGLMIKFYDRYDARKKNGGAASSVFSDLMTAFNRLATEKPAVLGVGAAVLYGSSLAPIIPGGHSLPSNSSSVSLGGAAGMIDSAMEMGLGLAQVAGSVVGSSVGAVAGTIPPGLSISTATLKLQCIDQLDKADAPPIPETYIFLLALQCLASLSDGFATYTLSAYSAILSARTRSAGETASRAPAALDWSTLDASDPKAASLLTVKDMAETSWPALLASLSFFIATSLDDDLFADVVSALQNFTSVCGVLGLQTPREALLTSLCKFAVPPAVVSHMVLQDLNPAAKAPVSVLSAGVESLGLGPAAPLPVGLSSRNFACLKALLSVSQYLAGSLDSIWFAVFETLQNADFVIRTNAARTKKRAATSAPPATPPRGGGGVVSPLSPTTSRSLSSPNSSIPVVPTEADEVAIQASIAKLFEVSRSLDDDAFKWFVGGLCRLNGEMIGLSMAEDGSVLEVSPGSLPSPASEAPNRRRSSGMNTLRTVRLDEKSFGVSKLGVVSLLNVHRLIYRESSVGWDIVTSHLLHVQHFVAAPSAIRLQAAEVLDQILVVAPRNLSTGGDELQRRIQTQVLVALAAQAEPSPRPQTSTDVEIRRMSFDTLIKILESNGHSFIAGWERIFHVLRTACPSPLAYAPPSPRTDAPHLLNTIDEDASNKSLRPGGHGGASYFGVEKAARTPILVRTGFPSLQLICTDFLGVLTVDELRDCIGTLAEFGKQTDDVNVALTVRWSSFQLKYKTLPIILQAGGLLWSVSDHLQAKRKEGDNDVAHGELWMFLLHQLLVLCQDTRQEARDGAISTVFRSISLYGTTLSKSMWERTMWEVVFPLLDSISATIHTHNQAPSANPDADELVPQAAGQPIRLIDKQWDDSKYLAVKSIGTIFVENLAPLRKTPRFDETFAAFVNVCKRSFIEDRPTPATAAMNSLEKVLRASVDSTEAPRVELQVAWAAWDEIGHSVVGLSLPPSRTAAKTLTQVNLHAYVKAVLPIYSPAFISFDLSRIHRLLAILKAVLTFARSPDYRPDIDTLTPLQAAVLEVVAVINLEVPGAASAVLSDLSEYLTLAFIAAFDSEGEAPAKSRPRTVQRVTYIALAKEVMPHVLWLYIRYKDDISIYEQGAVERMFAAYSLPLKLKHDCPAPSKYGSDEMLWKTATVNFLKAVREAVVSLEALGQKLSSVTFEGIWRQIVDGYRGALLADTATQRHSMSAEGLHEEENFDLALLVSIEKDILPHLGNRLVPDELILRLGKCLQTASRLYELDLPGQINSPPHDSLSSDGSLSDHDVSGPTKETRFDSDFDRQARGHMFGTTAEVVEVGRERFGYWCFDLLFLLCSDVEKDNEAERRRIAALCLPALLNRCTAIIKTYVADAPLRGKMPFPRERSRIHLVTVQERPSSALPCPAATNDFDFLCQLHYLFIWLPIGEVGNYNRGVTMSFNAPLLSLPPETLEDILILFDLDPVDVANFSAVCRSTRDFCRDNSHLWTSLFLNHFDRPQPTTSPQSYPYKASLQNRLRARGLINSAYTRNQLARVVSAFPPVLSTFISISQSALGIDSKNITFLSALFPPTSTAFAAEYVRLYTDHKRVDVPPITLQEAAHFLLLHGPPTLSDANKRLKALRLVYDVRNYCHETSFGPYRRDGSGRVDWTLLESIRTVTDFNVELAVEREGWGMDPVTDVGLEDIGKGKGLGWADTARRDVSGKSPRDWAGVEQEWIGTYAYLDWEVFEALNSDHERLAPGGTLRLTDFREAIGDLMSLKLVLDPPSTDPTRNDLFPRLSFTGTLGPRHIPPNSASPILSIVGNVSRGPSPDFATKWQYRVNYSGAVQWSLEGVQVGEPGSKAGVRGIWTHAARLAQGSDAAEGPCGPFTVRPKVRLSRFMKRLT
ncbi:hypothetical protein P7C70_g1641, partial [Phenoliferia sp. Uapishka_3]